MLQVRFSWGGAPAFSLEVDDFSVAAGDSVLLLGPSGAGNPGASYPSLSGQYATYTAAQLNAYADGSRKSDGSTKVMRNIAELLTPDQIKAISSYVQGLQ